MKLKNLIPSISISICILILIFVSIRYYRSQESPPPTTSASKTSGLKSLDLNRWLAFGDFRGYVEPCGCNPATDLGGLKRAAHAIYRDIYQGKEPNTTILSVGNLFESGLEEEKKDFMVDFLKFMNVDAVLFNKGEFEYFKDKKTGGMSAIPDSIPYVLSNAEQHGIKNKNIFPRLEFKDGQVFGLWFQPGQSKREILSTIETAKNGILKHGKSVLLFSGDDAALKVVHEYGFFDLVVTSHTSPFSKAPDGYEKKFPGTLHRIGDIYMVPSYGQGLLLGGELRKPAPQEAAHSGIFGDDDTQSTQLDCADDLSCKEDPLEFSDERLFIWLDKSYQEGTAIDKIYQKYEDARTSAFEAFSKQKLKSLENTQFVGAAACQGCHAQSHKIWSESHHASALATLQEVGKDKDPECVSCHVLGLNDDGGYVDQQATPQFANVQCENCHGPMKKHLANPTQPLGEELARPKGVCVSCHEPPHTSDFNYQNYWEKIKHKKESSY